MEGVIDQARFPKWFGNSIGFDQPLTCFRYRVSEEIWSGFLCASESSTNIETVLSDISETLLMTNYSKLSILTFSQKYSSKRNFVTFLWTRYSVYNAIYPVRRLTFWCPKGIIVKESSASDDLVFELR